MSNTHGRLMQARMLGVSCTVQQMCGEAGQRAVPSRGRLARTHIFARLTLRETVETPKLRTDPRVT
jgi:hypothetical protein